MKPFQKLRFFFPSHTDNEQKQLSSTTGHLGRTKRYPKINSETWIFSCLPIQKLWNQSFSPFLFLSVIKPCWCLFPSWLCLYHPFNIRLYYDIPSMSTRLLPFVSWQLTWFLHPMSLYYTECNNLFFKKKKIAFLLSKLLYQVKIFFSGFHHSLLTLQHDSLYNFLPLFYKGL